MSVGVEPTLRDSIAISVFVHILVDDVRDKKKCLHYVASDGNIIVLIIIVQL